MALGGSRGSAPGGAWGGAPILSTCVGISSPRGGNPSPRPPPTSGGGEVSTESSTRSTPGRIFTACASRGDTLKPPGRVISTSCAASSRGTRMTRPRPRPSRSSRVRICGTASVRPSHTRMPAPACDAAASSGATSCAVIRSASPSSLISAVTSTELPAARNCRLRARTSEKQVTSKDPPASDRRTHAIRLPVRVMRSFEPMTLPASFTRAAPAWASCSSWLLAMTPRRRSAAP